ncbi:MAG: ADP-glyceromanno-heptose 6-epimerase [Verrucomicrobia bacterium]|nr:ADP-glyceromanno-heptose 6-epimerase [Verrucomicrobiota bacterium]
MSERPLSDDKYIVVTGGAGFIGSNLIRYLNRNGFINIVVVDDLGLDEKWQNLLGTRFSQILPIYGLWDWLEGRQSEIQAIVHLGACSSTVERDADYLLENNTRYTIRLAEYALWNQIRFIYASSAATYGDGSKGFSDDHAKLPLLRPLNMYGYSKHLVDLWMEQQGVLDRVVGLKYFNIFGPYEAHKGKMASAIRTWVNQAQTQGFLRLFKSNDLKHFRDGEQQRDFLYIKDAVEMTAAFLHQDICGVFNIGRGTATTWNELAQAVFQALGLPPKIDYVEMPEELAGKYQNYTCADMFKYRMHAELPFDPKPITIAVIDYVHNYLCPLEMVSL